MKTLYKKESASYCSEVVTYKGNKFKISTSNGNCYSRIEIEIFTKNGDLATIATSADLNNTHHMNYIHSDERRLEDSIHNIKVAEDYIKKVYGTDK